MTMFKSMEYKVRVPARLRPEIDLKLEGVSEGTGQSVTALKNMISKHLRAKINQGHPPSGHGYGHVHKEYGQVHFCTPGGIQVAICVLEATAEIILVGLRP